MVRPEKLSRSHSVPKARAPQALSGKGQIVNTRSRRPCGPSQRLSSWRKEPQTVHKSMTSEAVFQ